MKKVSAVAAVAMGILAGQAHADGFMCTTVEGDLTVKAFNHVMPGDGTRVGSVMVLSDPTVSEGRKTIARFVEVEENLSNEAARYVADVDLRYNNSNRSGELISGTKLGQLDSIVLDVEFTYESPMKDGEMTTGKLILVKRNEQQIVRDLDCERYLKN